MRALTVKVLMGAAALAALQACVPLVVGSAAVGGTMVVSDRRTSGAQLEDQGIEMRASARVRKQVPERNHINYQSYNRHLLLTGEVPTEEQKDQVGTIAADVENVVKVYNELAVMPNSSLSVRASDSLMTTRVKSALVDAKDLYANSVSVTTERAIVYLMGRVTEREADRITDIASTTKGVKQVVSLLEIISEEEKARALPRPPEPASVRYDDPAASNTHVIAPVQPSLPENAPVERELQAPAPIEVR